MKMYSKVTTIIKHSTLYYIQLYYKYTYLYKCYKTIFFYSLYSSLKIHLKYMTLKVTYIKELLK